MLDNSSKTKTEKMPSTVTFNSVLYIYHVSSVKCLRLNE